METYKYYVYSINPIDFGWGFFVKIKDYIEKKFKCDAEIVNELLHKNLIEFSAALECADNINFNEFMNSFNFAMYAARKAGWDGDFSEEPVLIPVVDDTECNYGFMFKQSSNGSTFVILPHRCSRMEKISYASKLVDGYQ